MPQIRRTDRALPVRREDSAPAPVDTCCISASTKNRHFDRYLQQILQHTTARVSCELTAMPAAGLMFHGTEADFEAVEARPNRRVGMDGKTDWQGTAIFAAADPRVGLHYTARRGQGVSAGIDLRSHTPADQPITYFLRGGESLEDAMTKAYGEGGSSRAYIHLLDKTRFVHEPGLGVMEMITRDESANLGRLEIDARGAVDALVESGAVKVEWSAG